MGKLIKLASGMFNTHSYYGDCRMEIFSAHAALCGVSKETVARIMECVTVDSALSVIEADKALFKAVNNSIMSKIQFNLNRKLPDNIDVGAVAFTNIYGTLAISAEGKKILSCFGGQYE